MTKKSDAPAIRFKGFSDAWEQRKLGEMGQTYTGLSGKTKDDFGHGQARFVTYMNVFSNPISNPGMTEPIEIDPKQNEVEVGDVFFTTSSETPEEVGMSSILLEKRGKTYLNSFCFGFRPSEKIDSYYLAYMLRSESTRAKIILLAQGISRYNISKNRVMEIAVSLPSLDEQKMIGQYFSQLDNLITLHQRDSIMRFFGAWDNANAWEQRKLGDCFDERNESMPDGELISVTINDGIRKFSELGRHDNSNDDKSKYKKVCVGDIAYNSMRMWQGASGYSPYEGIVSPAYTVLSPKTGVVSRCLAYQFKLPEMIHTFQVNSQGITSDNWNLKYPAFSEIDIAVAKQVKEQELIASFFTNLDNLITLHQRERKNRLFGGKNVKQYNFSRLVLQLLRAMDSRLQRRGSSQGDYG